MLTISIDIANQISQLAESGLEALEHVHMQNSHRSSRQAMALFTDVIQAFVQIEQTLLNSGLINNNEQKLFVVTKSLRDGFDLMVKAYEHNDLETLRETMEQVLLPRYKQWQHELDILLVEHRNDQ